MIPFVVLGNVSKVAQIDYSLVANPTFTSKYMDVPLKVGSYSFRITRTFVPD